MDLLKELHQVYLIEAQVDSSDFKESNGKNPAGLGVWVFRDEDNDETFEFNGDYQKAVEAAKANLRKASTIKVIPD